MFPARTVISVINPDTVSVMIGFDSTTLPHLHLWKVLQKGQYVLGIEPSNSATLKGRVPAEELGLVPTLAAAASVTYQIDFTFSAGTETAQIEAS